MPASGEAAPEPKAVVSVPAATSGEGVAAISAGEQKPELPPTSAAPSTSQCPGGMQFIPGGRFWVGSTSINGDPDEMPRFQTQVGGFCLDRTEVTAAAYVRCELGGACSPAGRYTPRCTAFARELADHPINCVNWEQARAFCGWRSARLPSEVEWEYAARGGEAQLKYPWGTRDLDGHTCWKQAGTCQVASFAAGAFGLFDMSGNVWEWTADSFGAYPWPPLHGLTKVYRGGSFSRRFDKWMRLSLRNRYDALKQGSHLGFRCAASLKSPDCPYGAGAGGCLRGVETADCPRFTHWNGVRCARSGEPRCLPGTFEKAGFGCVISAPGDFHVSAEASGNAAVARERTAEFDDDCRSNQPGRGRAYRYSGATHHARNELMLQQGCQNRDVGIGWNSSCCPE